MSGGELMTVQALAGRIGGIVAGDGQVVVTGMAAISDAAPGDVVLAESDRHYRCAVESGAAAIITDLSAPPAGKPLIRAESPRRAFALALACFARTYKALPGIHPSCHVGDRVRCPDDVSVGFGCRLGDDVRVGNRAVIHPMVYLGEEVEIGEDCEVFPQAVILPRCKLGARVRIHSGAIIGADGFGYEFDGANLIKVPQIGTVTIGDDVEIGANSTIDRAKTGATLIGDGTKIDNLVHIAHNVKIGRSCIIVALTGISGSVRVGDSVTFGGQSGVKDHVAIGDGAVVAARGGVIGDIPAGAKVSGFPAHNHRDEMRSQALVRRLPDLVARIEELEAEVERLRKG